MAEKIKCPVCGKEDIPDFHKEDVKCPCCGTDLSIYKVLADYQEQTVPTKAKNNKCKIAAAAAAAIAIASVVFLFISKPQVTNIESSDVATLDDSIRKVSSELVLAKQEIVSLKKQLSNKVLDNIYIVKKNDSPCKISRKLYGTEGRYKEIEAIIIKPLQPGDTLYIK